MWFKYRPTRGEVACVTVQALLCVVGVLNLTHTVHMPDWSAWPVVVLAVILAWLAGRLNRRERARLQRERETIGQ